MPNLPILFEYAPGDDVTMQGGAFARANPAKYISRSGLLTDAALNILRDSHYENGIRTTLLESASANLLLWSEDLTNAVWTAGAGGTTVTADQLTAPDGTKTADLVAFSVTSGSNLVSQTVVDANPANKIFVLSAWIADGTLKWNNDQFMFHIRRGDATQAITVTKGAGTLKLAETVVVNGITWRHIYALYVCDATTNANIQILYRSQSIVGNYYLWGAQLERTSDNGGFVVPSSYMKTTAATVSRSADTLAFTLPLFYGRALWTYTKFIERGTIGWGVGNTPRILNIGKIDNSNPKLLLFRNGTVYSFRHTAADTTSVQSDATVGPNLGDTVEILCILFADGSVQLIQSINGGAEVASARSAAPTIGLEYVWSDTVCTLNQISGGFSSYQAARVGSGNTVLTLAQARLPATYILFTDTIGTAILANNQPFPGDRFGSWTPDSSPIGNTANRLSDELTFMFRTSDRRSVTLTLANIPSKSNTFNSDGYTPMDLALRLLYHLQNGGTCLVRTGDDRWSSYSPCAMLPKSKPTLQPSEKRFLEYTLTVQLISVATTPQDFSLYHR